MNLHPGDVLDALSRALVISRGWARGLEVSNSARSARFCSDVCESLDGLLTDAAFTRRNICVDDHGKRSPGEWLLDGTWTKDVVPDDRMKQAVPAKIYCAIECESSTVGFDYFTDFCKLLSIKSDIKLFLAGLNQKTKQGASRYIEARVRQSGSLVLQHDSTPLIDWYLAFWPSPATVDGQSLWEVVDNEEFAHLRSIVLYQFADRTFRKVETGTTVAVATCPARSADEDAAPQQIAGAS